jgi:hypothetical protein
MWPWGHLVIGYLGYSALSSLWLRRPPSGRATLLLVFGTQLPDLIDKPLAWTFHLLPSGRSLAHSLLVAVPLVILVYRHYRRHGHPSFGIAFGIGYLSHLFGDALFPFLHGEYAFLSFLGWPILPPPPYGVEQGFIAHFTSIELTPFFALQICLVVVTFMVWLRDGYPGVGELRSWVTPYYEQVVEK